MSRPEQTEKWLNQPQAQVWTHFPYICPDCNGLLRLMRVTIGSFPYQYADVELFCEGNCHKIYNFCLPQDSIMPTGLSIYDDEICLVEMIQALDYVNLAEPNCPFGHGEMRLSKIFGNQVYTDGTVRVQYRCDTCNYFIHKTVIEGKQK